MSAQYLSASWQVLNSVLAKVLPLDVVGREKIFKNVTLRPPKNASWGDLCTNAVLLVCSDDKDSFDEIGSEFTTAFIKLDFVAEAKLSPSGYINLKIEQDYWGNQLFDLCRDGVCYGMLGQTDNIENITVFQPSDTDGLVALRQLWNGEALARLAEKCGLEVLCNSWKSADQLGFSSKMALAKCGEQVLKLALLSNDLDYAIKFSPTSATDKSYDNPAFSLPYAEARIRTLLKQHMTLEKEEDGALLLEPVEEIKFNRELEIELSKLLCHGPMHVHKTLAESDMVYLTSFLQEVTLLFFRLYKQERLQSSDYLVEKGQKMARQLLLKAVATQISGCLKLMGIDKAEEFI